MAETENTAQETTTEQAVETTMYDRFKERNNPEPEKQVQQTTEPIKEETTPQSEEKPVEGVQNTEKTEVPEEGKVFDVDILNKQFGTSFENEDSLKGVFESQEKFKDFDSQLQAKEEALTTAQERYDALLDSIDPEKVIPNKEAVALSQLSEKYPNADLGMLSKIRKADLGQMDKLDALVMIDKLNVPSNVPDSVREAVILEKLGIDATDRAEFTDVEKYRIESEFTNKATSLSEIRDFQPEINKFDFEAEKSARQQKNEAESKALKTHNEQALKILLNDYKETKSSFKEGDKEFAYSFTVEDEFKQKYTNDILDRLTDSGIKISKENASEIATDIDNLYWLQNRHKIVNDIVKQALSKEKEQVHKEIHSDSPINTNEAPPTKTPIPKTMMESYRTGQVKTR